MQAKEIIKFIKCMFSTRYAEKDLKQRLIKLYGEEKKYREMETKDLIEMRIHTDLKMARVTKDDSVINFISIIGGIAITILIFLGSLSFNVTDYFSEVEGSAVYNNEKLEKLGVIIKELIQIKSAIKENHFPEESDKYKQYTDELEEFITYVSHNTYFIIKSETETNNFVNNYYEMVKNTRDMGELMSNYIDDIEYIKYLIFDLNNTIDIIFMSESKLRILDVLKKNFVYFGCFLAVTILLYLLSTRITYISQLENTFNKRKNENVTNELIRRCKERNIDNEKGNYTAFIERIIDMDA